MNISSETINILKNFSGINANLVFKPGQGLSTISEAKTIMAKATVTEDFPVEFGVYDLSEFLSVMNLVDSPTLVFEDKSVFIHGTGGQKVRYYYSELEILTQPTKDITMPECEVNFNLSADNLDKIKKAAAVLGHAELMFSCEGGDITAKVFDEKDATANTFDIDLGIASTEIFKYVFSISNLKMLHGDYDVSISSKLISNWKNTNTPVEYFIALEKSSKYGV